MKTLNDTIRRLWPHLTGEPEKFVRRSATGKENEWLRAAWSSHYADRAMLFVTIAWLVLRYREWTRIEMRPDALYEPQIWIGKLVFPILPDPVVFYVLLVTTGVLTILALARPRWYAVRIPLLISILLVSAPGTGFGHVEHTAHLLFLAHVYSMFRPLGEPRSLDEAGFRARGYNWYLLGLLAVYTASGLWKVVDLTIRDILKPGVTWLAPEAMVATSIAAMRGVDLPMMIPQLVERTAWIFPIGYVMLTLIFSASFIAAFRRPFLLVVVPTIVLFHILNAVVMYVLFVFTIFVAVLVLAPYDLLVPSINRRLVPIRDTYFGGRGHAARYEVRYDNGDVDCLTGFYAYRERLRQHSALAAAALYYPGLGWLISRGLEFAHREEERPT